MGSSRARRRALALTMVAVVVLSGCQNLPKRVAGKKCSIVGEHAQDGTWVLKCGTNKRWNRLMTIADANNAVANWLRSQAPAPAPAPTTTAPPAPRLTTFGDLQSGDVGDQPYFITPGRYSTVIPTGTACIVEVNGNGIHRLRGGDSGPQYIDLPAGTFIRSRGGCQWTLGEPGPQVMPANGDGMYRVGTEIQPGLYTAPGSSECYWETSTSADASIEAITDIYVGDGPQLAVIDSTDRFFASDDCGPWTRLPAPPARFLQIATSIGEPFNGSRAFFADGQVNVSSSANVVDVTAGAYRVVVQPQAGGTFATGIHDFFTSQQGSLYAMGILKNGRPCTLLNGSLEVRELALGASNEPTAMYLSALGRCDGLPIGVNIRF